eukprot:TRINITY_DN32638_c0_g1_i1.p1 TRINITY_DN32638_c0_g1~~TRINITY_DN32638_c0_g1_i1.p1  ORF type:complete len:286 (-),score=47.52 TRINITY_DN32638_c0_g1_i1:119-976(-)
MYAAKNPTSGFTPFADLPPNPQVLYGWGKKYESCPKCGLKDFGNSTVDMHIKRDHPRTPQGTYSCWICPYTFRKQGQFVKHHREGHAGEKMACWVCGEKNWSSTALIYNHIKRNHPGYRKGIAREYFATLRNNASNGKVHVTPRVSSKVTSSSNFDSLSDSTSMDSYYSEYSTDLDDDGAPIFGSSLSSDDYADTRLDLEEDFLVDEDGAPIVETLSSENKTEFTSDHIVIQQEKSIIVTNAGIAPSSPPITSSMVMNNNTFAAAATGTDPCSDALENEDLILGI